MKDHHNLGRSFWLAIMLMFISLQTPALAQHGSGEKVSLSLHQADIQDLVRWASSVTHKTIIIHPSVKGSITVVAGEEMSREQAYEVFLSVLQVHGFMVIDTDQALKVVPIDIGKQSDIALDVNNPSPEDMVVRIIKLKNISANDIIALVRPMLPRLLISQLTRAPTQY